MLIKHLPTASSSTDNASLQPTAQTLLLSLACCLKTRKITSLGITLALSLYFVVVINIPLLNTLITILGDYEHLNWWFTLTLPLFFLAVFNAFFTLLSFKYLLKPMFALMLLSSSVVSYLYANYGLYVDAEMIGNFVDTNYGEAVSYLNLTAFLWVFCMGIIPSVIVFMVPVAYYSLPRELCYKLVSIGFSLLIVVLILLFFYKDYASLGRNNSYLKKIIVPTYYVSSLIKYINLNYIKPTPEFQTLGADAHFINTTDTTDTTDTTTKTMKNAQGDATVNKPNLVVIMLGETARANNFQLNGYQRKTNPFTLPFNPIAFQDVSSCGTATNTSVPCMFSRFDRTNFDNQAARNQDNVLDILSHAGASTLWLENDGGCKGVCDRTQTLTFSADMENEWCDGEYCKDGILLANFDRSLSQLNGDNQVLVMHMVGSHGPTYYQRYPEAFRHFKPDCPRSDIQNCSDQAIINTYDNTIYYDDYIMAKILSKLEQYQDRYNTGFIYVSDHGESLGESGLYLHGMPYSLAPKEQTQIPLLIWLSAALQHTKRIDVGCLRDLAANGTYSHDNIFDSLLGIMDVRTVLYRPEQDIFSTCRTQ